jgi:hypothetical protein
MMTIPGETLTENEFRTSGSSEQEFRRVTAGSFVF